MTWLRYDIAPVGVFVNAPVKSVAALYRDGVIAIAQLHGAEDSNYIAALKALTASVASGPVPVIKAVRVERREDILVAAGAGADYLLPDNGAGGTGKRFDWTLLAGGDFFGVLPVPCFLAGGLDVYTIEEALRFKPFGIDVSGGAETGGIKDRDKMLRLVEIVRNHI
jgi:phosphoribosylanthranilate isomerase